MTHVSKQQLDKKLLNELFKQLSRMVVRADRATADSFLQGLLTDTEQIMLAKRLAVIYMFHEGCSTYKVIHTLKMSSSTVVDMHHRYQAGDYDALKKVFGRSKVERDKLWKTIELILRGGMPSLGKDRWTTLRKK